MTDIAERFAEAQEARLRNAPALALAMGLPQPRIYSIVPTNAPTPYVVIGEDQVLDDSDECQNGSEIFSTVHVWTRSEPPSTKQARDIASVLRDLLDADLGIAGHETIIHAFEDTRFPRDPGGAAHAVLTLRYVTSPSEA